MSAAQYRMPAEWESQARIWLPWPHRKQDWPGKFAPIPWVIAEIARVIALRQDVGIIVQSSTARAQAQDFCRRAGVDMNRISFLVAASDRGWLRDCGPIFVRDTHGKRTALHFGFNGWAKYRNWRHDALLAPAIAGQVKAPLLRPLHRGKPVVLEGGALDVNGKGSIIVTEECLVSDHQIRNRGWTKADYETVFARYLGAPHTIWLQGGIAGDDTHGHVDDITRFVAENKIVTVVESNKKSRNYAVLRENLKRLNAARNTKGKPFEIIELPMPQEVIFEDQLLPASYANFLITNHSVLVPVFNDVNDRSALETISACFPSRDVIGIYARDLVWGLGTIHCLTQQEISA